MSKALDRSQRAGSDPIQIGSTKLSTDGNNDLTVQDTSNNRKKILASEVHLGDSSNVVILKKGSDNKIEFQTQASGGSATSSNAGGTVVYATISAMTAVSASAGDQALVTANSGLYVHNGGGWYKVATINTSPTISSPSTGGSFTLALDGTATTIELVGADVDEGTTLQNSYAVTTGSLTNGGGATATITTSSTSNGTYTALNPSTNTTNRFFKVTPTTNTSYAGDFTLTFSVSDGINAATTVQSFSLQFSSYGSAFFDGTDDYLTIPSSSDFSFGTNDFTIEYWIKPGTNGGSYTIIFSLSGSTGAKRFEVAIHSSNIRVYTDTGSWRNTSFLPTSDEWTHMAFVRDYSGNTLKMYANGVEKWSVSNNRNYDEQQSIQIGSYGSASYGDLDGYLSNFRIVNGTAVYTSNNFTVPTSPLTAVTNTKLLTLNESDGITDDSSSNHTLTKVGNVTQHASNPFPGNTIGYGSLYFDGTDDYLTVASSSDFALGTGDFTIEGWVYFTDTSYEAGSNRRIFALHNGGNAVDNLQIIIDEGSYSVNGDLLIFTNSVLVNLNTDLRSAWHHIALVRSSGTLKFYLDGVEKDSASNTQNYSPNSGSPTPLMGQRGDNKGDYNGYISNLRMVVGTAVYTSNFTPSTTPLTAITNTKLLTAQRSTPLSVTSGSTRFDGTNDKLVVSSTNIINSLANFTVEAWAFYDIDAPSDEQNVLEFNTGTRIIFGRRKTASGLNAIYIYSAATSDLYTNNAAHDIIYNRWVHLAWVKEGQNFRMYINGKNVAGNNNNSATNMAATPSASLITIGMNSDGNERMDGYLSNVRVSSTARYSADFATPTSAFSNDSDTILLTCQNSSGSITDASSNNHTIVEHGGISANTFNVKFIATDQSTSGYNITTNGNTRNAKNWPFNYSG